MTSFDERHVPGDGATIGLNDVAEVMPRAIRERAGEIVRAADAGQPPVALLIPDLDHLIDEGFYWRQAERMIRNLLTPDFETAGSKPVPIACHRRGRCYRRVPPVQPK